ncbi:MAG: hypothetical protein QMD76_06250 [Anaerosomatales bacterium]|nr:hypothetical protein [Anaerosomatales bacterium]MDI6844038.1 hypothetical protein [Anaerosomatales bacterium]
MAEGHDPYDALRARRVPSWARRHARLRQGIIQVRKRVPIDLSRVLGVEPFVMAKTCACFLAAAARAGDGQSAAEYRRELLGAAGNLGDGAWGYEFDVQTRWSYYPYGTPNMIVTAFAGRAFGASWAQWGSQDDREEFMAAADFARSTLFDEEAGFFRYTPLSSTLIHNANLLGAALCAAAGVVGGRRELVDVALRAAERSIAAQRADGSWPYGEGQSLGWSDNFHTAYNLDGLLLLWLATEREPVREALDRGVQHWVRDFFGPRGEPKYYPDKPFPYDIHTAATAVDVAARLASWGWDTGEVAERVAAWATAHLVDSASGQTYYQVHRVWKDKRHFVRWGDAHWALAQASLQLVKSGRRDPLEQAVADNGR